MEIKTEKKNQEEEMEEEEGEKMEEEEVEKEDRKEEIKCWFTITIVTELQSNLYLFMFWPVHYFVSCSETVLANFPVQHHKRLIVYYGNVTTVLCRPVSTFSIS